MIVEIGTLGLGGESSVQSARSKTLVVAEQLGIGHLTATRLSTAVSEMTRAAGRWGSEPRLEFAIDSETCRLVLRFVGCSDRCDSGVLTPFFDSVRNKSDVDGAMLVEAQWEIPGNERPTESLLNRLREVVQEKSRDELVMDLQSANSDLRQSLEDLSRTTTAKERMESELNIGRDIQMRMLPTDFPAFPSRREFDIFAVLHPAREVGGDFYDFFLIDEDHLVFGVGDVSGKGVPAALFMAMTKTLIKSRASNDGSPASILTHVNDEMAANNEASMFVTIWLGIVNLRTGDVVYCNAGHNPPYRKRVDGGIERLTDRHGPVAGAIEGVVYGESRLHLDPDDTLFLYTDGVTEAMDPQQHLYSEERLADLLLEGDSEASQALVERSVADVWRFQADADQADDVTVLAVEWFGDLSGANRMTFAMSIDARAGAIAEVIAEFESFADTHALGTDVRRTVSVVLDELLSNIVSYAYNDDLTGQIDVVVDLTSSRLAVTLTDSGRPFNPFAVALPDTDLTIEEREIGGLGIHLVRQMMDETSYVRRTEQNVVRVAKMLTTNESQSQDG